MDVFSSIPLQYLYLLLEPKMLRHVAVSELKGEDDVRVTSIVKAVEVMIKALSSSPVSRPIAR